MPVFVGEESMWDEILGHRCPFCHRRGKVKEVKTEELGTKPAFVTRIRKEVSLSPSRFLEGYDKRVRVKVKRTIIRYYFVCRAPFCGKKWYSDETVDNCD